MVLSGATLLPTWMALTSPLLLLAAWLTLVRVLPRPIVDHTEGAGLNISNVVFMALLTLALW